MGFFSDLKEDLAQAVNELVPEEGMEKLDTEPDIEDADISLDEMLKNIDNYELPEEVELPEEAEVSEETGLSDKIEVPAVEESVILTDESMADESMADESMADDLRMEQILNQMLEDDSIEIEDNNTPAVADEGLGAQKSEEEQTETAEAFEIPVLEPEEKEELPEKKEINITEEKVEMEMPRVASDESAVITAGMVITGDITTEGSIDIIGTVNGNVEALGKLNITGHINGNSNAAEIYAESAKINGELVSAGAVKVGASSVIIGNITATSAAIAGAVKGDIDVRGPVILDASAIVMGNIKSKSVQINNGAVIEGMCSQCYADVSPTSFFEEYKN